MIKALNKQAETTGFFYSIFKIDRAAKCLEERNPTENIPWLTPIEEKQLSRFKTQKRQNEWLAGRFAAKSVILKYLEQRSETSQFSDLELIYDKNGRPHLKNRPELTVSISHSHEYAVAVAADYSIGVDIERIHDRPLDSLKNYFFSSDEQTKLSDCADRDEKQTLGTVYWTRKEAVSKLYGLGGQMNFKEIDTVSNSIYDLRCDDRSIQLLSCNNNDYCVSIAFQKENPEE